MASPEEPSSLSPSEAFSLLSDGTRVSILRALAEQLTENPHDPGVSFAELRKRVGVEDAGQFNYHLGKLRGHFLEHDDGEYHLRYAGLMVVSAILAGTYTERGQTRTTEIDSTCPQCGEALTATYEDGAVNVDCETHGTVFTNALPPGAAVDRSIDELLALATYRTQWHIEQTTRGVCPFCWDRIATTVPVNDPADDEQLLVRAVCERCWFRMQVPVGACVVRHPAVVSLFHDHAIDIRDESFLDLDFVAASDTGTLVSTDPTRIEVTIELGDDELTLTLDETTAVIDTQRNVCSL